MNHNIIFVLITTIGLGAAVAAGAEEIKIIEVSKAALQGKPMAPVASAEPFLELISKNGGKYVEVSQYKSADGRLEVSIKRYEPVTLKLNGWPVDEGMHFLSGRVQITDAAGRSHVYGAGDSIIMPKGFVGEWKQLSTIEMVTTTYNVG